MEMGVEKERFTNLKDFRRQHIKEKISMWVVIAGVFIEIATGAGLAAYDGAENMKIANQIAKNDPMNLPIKSIRADLFVLVRGDFDEVTLSAEGIRREFAFDLSGTDGALVELGCKDLDSWKTFVQTDPPRNSQPPNSRWFSMSFAWPGDDVIIVESSSPSVKATPAFVRYWIDRNNVSVTQLDKEMTGALLTIPGVVKSLEIIRGTCVVTINGTIQKQFTFPKFSNGSFIECSPLEPTTNDSAILHQ
jgi:hypothetical protein